MKDKHSVVSVAIGMLAAIAVIAGRYFWAQINSDKISLLLSAPLVWICAAIAVLIAFGSAFLLTRYERFDHPIMAIIYGAAVPNLLLDLLGLGAVWHQ